MNLPIKLKHGKLVLTKDLTFSFAARKIKELKPYLYQSSSVKKSQENKNAYLIYRGICFKKDKEIFKLNNLRYDVTLIYPFIFGEEFNKTLGHWHKTPEIYEVLSGQALFLIQGPKNSAQKIYLKLLKPKSKIIIPAFYNHLIINPYKKPLIVADIFSIRVKSDYSFLRKKHGAGYYILKNKIIKNPHYQKVGKIQNKLPKTKISIKNFKNPLYLEFINNPKKFEFLHP